MVIEGDPPINLGEDSLYGSLQIPKNSLIELRTLLYPLLIS